MYPISVVLSKPLIALLVLIRAMSVAPLMGNLHLKGLFNVLLLLLSVKDVEV